MSPILGRQVRRNAPGGFVATRRHTHGAGFYRQHLAIKEAAEQALRRRDRTAMVR